MEQGPVIAPLTFQHAPRIHETVFVAECQRFRSPVAPIAGHLYRMIAGYGLDPAVALAFFAQESTFGTRGRSVEWKTWGNVRTPHRRELATYRPEYPGGMHVEPNRQTFAVYDSWPYSVADWCFRILERYVARGLNLVDDAMHVYAPSWDRNNVIERITFAYDHVLRWQNPAPVTYRVAVATANVRKYAGTNYKILRQLSFGNPVSVWYSVPGVAVGTNNEWCYSPVYGYLHSSVLKRA